MDVELLTGPQRRVYPRPPIQEALCQLMFAEPLEWSIATPGLIYNALRENYPAEPDAQEELQAELRTGPQAGGGFSFNRGGTRVVYKDDSGSRLAVVNQRSFSVNSLPPYEGWESLYERMRSVGNALAKAGIDCMYGSVSIRYINRIVIPSDRVELSDYFNIPILTPVGKVVATTAFLTRVQSVLSDDATTSITFGSVDPSDGSPTASSTFLLDIELGRRFSDPLRLEKAGAVASELKRRENEQFESLITDQAREWFEDG